RRQHPGRQGPLTLIHLVLSRHSHHRFRLLDLALLARAKGRRHLPAGVGGPRLRGQGGEEIAMDWNQLWQILSAPDNVPIIAMIPLLAFYIYLGGKQALANDKLITELEANPALAKTHHRKTWPFRPGWQKEVHVWPFLLRVEFLAAII